MNKYENEVCPYCHSKLFPDDNIAVCPDCGAPHHKECFLKNGKCGHYETHGTENQWQPTIVIPEPEIQDSQDKDQILCMRCGTPLQKGSFVCENCKMPVINEAMNILSEPIDLKEEVEGITTKEIISFVTVNPFRYLAKFKMFSKTNKKTSWNWAAFLFPHLWFFFRKNYVFGAIFSVIIFLTTLFSIPFMNSFQTMSEMLSSNSNILADPKYLMALGANLVSIVSRIIAGLYGDYLYKKQVFDAIKNGKDMNIPQEETCKKYGGTSLYVPIFAYLIVSMLTQYLGTVLF